jgi:NAD(P)-dependent dehydrogenase (short-subunit alcohol dehydrogenase family)
VIYPYNIELQTKPTARAQRKVHHQLTTLHRRTAGKVIIITGCNSPLGIGRASAHHFANNGAKAIYICDLAADHLDKHKREIEQKYPGVEIHPRQVDAGEEDQVAKVVDDALEKYGRLGV